MQKQPGGKKKGEDSLKRMAKSLRHYMQQEGVGQVKENTIVKSAIIFGLKTVAPFDRQEAEFRGD